MSRRRIFFLFALDSTKSALFVLVLLLDDTVGRVSLDTRVFAFVVALVHAAAGLAMVAAALACARVCRDGVSLVAASLTVAMCFLRCFDLWAVADAASRDAVASAVRTLGAVVSTLGGDASTLGGGLCSAVIDLVSRCVGSSGVLVTGTLGGACVCPFLTFCNAGSCDAACPASVSSCFSCRICSSLPLLLSALMLLMHAEIAFTILSARETSGRVMCL